jgi:adenosylcobinamide-GDP ribazoletransferase
MDDQASPITRLFIGWPHDIAVAGAFLTRLPFRPKGNAGGNAHASDLSRAMRAFPLIGALVGGIAGGGLWLAAQADLHPLACAFIGLIIAAGVTGALHEDGLADVADGMGGYDRERRLEIMRDSRSGAFGVLALILAIGLKAAILAGLPGPGLAWGAFVAAAALSRAVMPVCMIILTPAREDGLGQGAGRPEMSEIAQALAIGGIVAIAVLGWGLGLGAMLAALAAVLLTGWLARARFGGYTGDVLGAVQQSAEIFILIVVGAILP